DAGGSLTAIVDVARDGTAAVEVSIEHPSAELIQTLADEGIERVILAERALDDATQLDELIEAFPDLLVLTSGLEQRRISTRGWARTVPVDLLDLIDEANGLGVGGVEIRL